MTEKDLNPVELLAGLDESTDRRLWEILSQPPVDLDRLTKELWAVREQWQNARRRKPRTEP